MVRMVRNGSNGSVPRRSNLSTQALLAALCANACGLEAERCAGDDDAAAAEMLQLMGAVLAEACQLTCD